MNKFFLLFYSLSLLALISNAQTVTDYDGNIYNTVTIGSQVWMVENLKVTHYNNGDPIIDGSDSASWGSQTEGAYCNYDNNPLYVQDYGHLYNWYAAHDSLIAPLGWHVPTAAEVQTLQTYSGGEGMAGAILKEAGTAHWNTPNSGATNSSGFTALPGGWRYINGSFQGLGENGYWWAATEFNAIQGWLFGLYHDNKQMYFAGNSKNFGFSIRCIKDSSATGINEENIDQHLQIYPNPVLDNITIETYSNLDIEISNIVGQIIKRFKTTDYKTDIDISDYASGVYIIRVLTDSGIMSKKVIKK